MRLQIMPPSDQTSFEAAAGIIALITGHSLAEARSLLFQAPVALNVEHFEGSTEIVRRAALLGAPLEIAADAEEPTSQADDPEIEADEPLLQVEIEEDLPTSATLLEVAARGHGSNRLVNALRRAEEQGTLEMATVLDWLATPEPILVLAELPNVGRKTAEELAEIIDHWQGGEIRRAQDAEPSEEPGVDPAPDEATSSVRTGVLAESELAALALAPVDGRDLEILVKRVQGTTLNDIGKALQITRARVQQLEARARARVIAALPDKISERYAALAAFVDAGNGERKLRRVQTELGLKESDIRLLCHLIGHDDDDPLEYRENNIRRRSTTEDHDTWNQVIFEALKLSTWPVSARYLLDQLSDLPSSYISQHLQHRFGARAEQGRMILTMLPTELRVTFALRHIGRPAGVDEILAAHNKIFEPTMSEDHLRSYLSAKTEFVIVALGTYALEEMLELTQTERDDALDHVLEYLIEQREDIEAASGLISVKVIHKDLTERELLPPTIDNPNFLYGLVRADRRFETSRGGTVGLKTSGTRQRISLSEMVCRTVDDHGPISIDGIIQHLAPIRSVMAVNVDMVLNGSPEHIRVSPGVFDRIENVMPIEYAFEVRDAAVTLLRDHGPQTLEALQRLLRGQGLDQHPLSNSSLSSLLRKSEEVQRSGAEYLFKPASVVAMTR